MSSTGCRLYLVSPPEIDAPRFSGQLEAAFDGGDVACLQLRLKDCDDARILRAAELLAPICNRRDVPLLINDRPDLAAIGDSDGAHIGQEDATFEEARRLLGPDKVIGVTCHDSRDLAIAAVENGADYVAFRRVPPDRHEVRRDAGDAGYPGMGRGHPAGPDRRHRRDHAVELSSAGSGGREFSGRRLGRVGP